MKKPEEPEYREVDVLYNEEGTLSRPNNPGEILSALKDRAIRILKTQPDVGGSIQPLLGLVGKISTKTEDYPTVTGLHSDAFWFDGLCGLRFLTRFTALRLIIDREAELKEYGNEIQTILGYLLSDPIQYDPIFPVLKWASEIKDENRSIDGLLTSLVTYAAMVIRNNAAKPDYFGPPFYMDVPNFQSDQRSVVFTGEGKYVDGTDPVHGRSLVEAEKESRSYRARVFVLDFKSCPIDLSAFDFFSSRKMFLLFETGIESFKIIKQNQCKRKQQ